MKKLTFLILLAVCGNSCFGQIITTIAGSSIGTSGYSGDNGAATAALLHMPAHIATNNSGDIFFTDYSNYAIRKINASGIISTIAGNGTPGYFGDNGPATASLLNGPNGMWSDAAGNLYFADMGNNVIRKISTAGIITTVAGDGTPAYGGDGSAATLAQLNNVAGVYVDNHGNIIIADYGNQRIRKVNTSGIISTIAGTGYAGFSGDNGPATDAMIYQPAGSVYDALGNLYFADQLNNRIRVIDTAGIIRTFAGNGMIGFIGDGLAATSAELYYPSMVAIDGSGNLLIDDSYNNVIRKVDVAGIITTIAGNSLAGYSGDYGPATAAKLNQPWGFGFDACGNLLIADAFNNAIRKVTYNSVLPPISASGTLYADSSITLTNAVGGGKWSINSFGNSTIATIDSATGKITGVSAGTVVVTYTSDCGITTDTVAVHRNTTFLPYLNSNATLVITPNPNKGIFTIKGTLPDFASTQDLAIDVMDMLGRIIYTGQLRIDNGVINKTVTLNDNTTKGIYILRMKTGAANEQMLISVEH